VLLCATAMGVAHATTTLLGTLLHIAWSKGRCPSK